MSTLRAFVADVLTATAARARTFRRATFTVPAEIIPLEAFLSAEIHGESLLWDPGAGWSFAGRAESHRVESSGAARFDELRTRGAEALAATFEQRAPECGDDTPAVAMFGGVAFVPGGRDAAWRGFADASFSLPRWLYARRGDRAFVRLTVDASELASPRALFDEIERVEHGVARAVVREPAPSSPGVLDELGDDAWRALVVDALSAIDRDELQKVVLARRSRFQLPDGARAIDPVAVLERLRTGQPGCVRFAFERAGRTFVGATPERLFALHARRVETEALAGSAPRRAGDDEARTEALLASEKDRREHALVVAGIVAALRALGADVEAPSATPRVRTLRQIHHLWTPLAATLPASAHALDLLGALHPTPALAGTPRDAAVRFLTQHEPAPRGWYGAPVGWFDGCGDGAFAVAIRSALLDGRGAWLYAGAGIVRGSVPALEYAETHVKQSAMLAALAGTAP